MTPNQMDRPADAPTTRPRPAGRRFLATAISALLLLAGQMAARADSLAVGTTLGSQIFIDGTTGIRTWNFGITSYGSNQGVSLDALLATLSASVNNQAPLVVQVYNGLGGTGTVIASATSAASNWTNQFKTGTISFGSAPLLTTGYYSLALSNTSPANQGFLFKPSNLTLNGTSGVLSSSLWVSDTSTAGNAGTTLASSGTVLAGFSLSGTSYNFGNYRYATGSSSATTFSLVNNALATSNNMTQALSGTGSVTSGATISGLPTDNSPLAVSGTTSLSVSLTRGVIGANSGTATLNFSSVPGSSTTSGTTALTPTLAHAPSITMTGTGWSWANAKVSSGTLAFGNLRTGAAATTQTVAVGNQAVSVTAYQDLLDVSGSTSNAKVTATGFQNLVSSTNGTTTSNVSLAANTASAGSLDSSVSLTYTSDANGVAGLSNGSATIVGGAAPTIATTGGVFDYATAVYSGTTLAFGVIHQGAAGVASQNVAFGNQTVTNGLFQDSLNVSGSTGNALVTATGFTGLGASTGGASTQNLVVSVNTATAGSLAGTIALSLVSNANGVAGLSNGTATTIGGGVITTTGQVYTGQSVWNTNGGGQWGTPSSNFGSNWQTNDGSPGLDAGFANTDTATFGNAVTSGTATVTITAATPSVRSITFSNAVASYAVGGASGGSLALLNAGTNAATVSVTAGSHSISAGVALNSRATMDVAAGSRLTVSGAMSGTNGLLKAGSGVLAITGVNTYTGATTVSSGTLSVNGSISSSSLTTVQAGATLAGSGTVGNTVVYGSHTPGNSPGVQTTGSLTYQSGASLTWELIANSISGRGTNYDGIDVNGTLTFAGSTSLALSFSGTASGVDWSNAFWSLDHTGTNGWLIYSGADSLSGFANLTISGTNWADGQGDMLETAQPNGTFTTYQSGNDVYLNYSIQAVPEPETLVLAGLGLAIASFAARRRRSRQA